MQIQVATFNGAVETTDQPAGVSIPLTNASFIQKAGTALVLIAEGELTFNKMDRGCGVFVEVRTDDSHAGLFLVDNNLKGDPGELADVEALPAPASDTPRTLSAIAVEQDDPDGTGCDGVDGVTWTIHKLTVDVVTLS